MNIKEFNYGVDKTNELFELLEKQGTIIKPAEKLIVHNFIVGVLNEYKNLIK